MRGTEDTGRTTVELYVRSLYTPGAHERQEQLIEALTRLAERGAIDDFSVVVWGKYIPLEGATGATDTSLRRRITAFEQWAAKEGVSLDSFYRTREATTLATETSQTVLTLPMFGLAEYEDGDLVQVSPCTDGDCVTGVESHVRALGGDLAAAGAPTEEPMQVARHSTGPSQGDADD